MPVHGRDISESPTDLDRRRFLGWLTGVISGLIALLMAVPLVGSFLAPAFVRKQELWLDLASEDEVTETPKAFDFRYRETDGWRQTVERRTAYALRDRGSILVLSNICTHLGCAVRWDPSRRRYVCPCHGGLFTRTGQVAKGPPPRPLNRYTFRVRRGKVQIRIASA
jgi:menaquinol-cytochrome c reductase iron-sulfur subunit